MKLNKVKCEFETFEVNSYCSKKLELFNKVKMLKNYNFSKKCMLLFDYLQNLI